MPLRFIIGLLSPLKYPFNIRCLETEATKQQRDINSELYIFILLHFQCIMFVVIEVFPKSFLSMFTTSQFLQIYKFFEVGDTLGKTLLRYFYIGSQSSDWINFLPGFCKDTHQKYLPKHILSPL